MGQESSMPRLSLYLLGPPRLELDGEPLEIGRRKAAALIAYLAVTGQGQARDALATLFWPEYEQSRARAALRRTLSTLNRALGGAWIEADRETIDLRRGDDLWVDIKTFRTCLTEVQAHDHPKAETCPDCLTRLAEAAALYHDDFMAGFTLRDSPEFDDWQFFQAESLRRELVGALERLARTHCALGEYEPAVDYARRWLRLDPLHEEAHRQLMQLYTRTDQRPAALRQYQECVRVLAEELGIAPSEETTTLYELIQSGELSRGAVLSPAPLPLRPPAPLPAFLSGPPRPRLHTPFVAREDELAQLWACLNAALDGGGHAAFVTGEAGSGKTALVHEFAYRAQEAVPDLVVAVGNCNTHTGLGDPYLPFREILSLLTGDIEAKYAQGAVTQENGRRLWVALPRSLHALVELGPDLINSFIPATTLAARAGDLEPEWNGWADHLQTLVERQGMNDATTVLAQSDLFEQYTHLLQTLAREHPLLLLVDDAQWADAASVNLLFHLSRQLTGNRILLTVTYRPDEVALGRGGERHPLEPVINELKRTYGDVWINVESAMGRPFIDALLDTEPNRLEEKFRAALHHQTEGHPLFTVELLHTMQGRGDLVRDPDGYWTMGPALDWKTLPARVEAVIEERVARLETGLRDVLAVASVEGEIFTAQVVARVQGIGERPLLGALSQQLERRHHLVQSHGEVQVDHKFLSRYRFIHTMFQQYLYNTFSPGERRLLHGEIAAALEDLYQEEGKQITVQLARHYAEAGQVEQAITYLLRAGDQGRDLYAFHEAIDFYKRALAFLREEGDHERTARTMMKLGLTYHLAFKFKRARQAYEEGFALWKRAGTSPVDPLPPAPHPLRLQGDAPVTLDPTMSIDTASGGIIQQIFSGLVTLNAELDVIPEMAQSWEVLAGGRNYIFHLRDDARWSDEAPVTAEDFVYAWRRVLDPKIESPNASYLYDIKGARAYHQGELADPEQLGVRALDPVTLLVELEDPTSYFPQLLTQPPALPVPRQVVEAHAENWTETEHLVTNGPFQLERWQPGHSMVLARNPEYPGQFTGNIQEVNLMLKLDESTEALALYEADHLDIVYLNPSPRANRMRQRHPAEYLSGPTLHVQYIGLNASQPPFDDRRVRRAFALAADKDNLANLSLSGYTFPATGGFIPPGMPGHSPEIGLPYDPERARALLAEAGYPNGQGFPVVEGVLAHREQVLLDLAESWHQTLGVEVVWRILDWGQILDHLERDAPPLFRMGWQADYPDPDNPLRVGTRVQWIGWQNEAYTELLEQARRIADHAERIRLYQRADRILVEEAAIVPLFYGRQHWLVKPWVRQFSLSPMFWPYWKTVIIEPHG
jgi:ABC-type oligopeptide transport system substrate-binding subunit/DNA-binding SARP family transcriptional activator